MKLWVDELREAPKGWEWAHTINEAIQRLVEEEIHELSMDYNVSLLVSIGVGTQYEVQTDETFEPVAIFCTYAFPPNSFPITIHSDSDEGQKRLSQIFEGWEVTIDPAEQPTESPSQEIILVKEKKSNSGHKL
jgi:hypothetical protein